MISSLLKGLSEEKVVFIDPSKIKLPFALEGIVRLVDRRGNTICLVLDKDTIEEIEEELESSNPEFLASLEESRRSGRISGKIVKKKIGFK